MVSNFSILNLMFSSNLPDQKTNEKGENCIKWGLKQNSSKWNSPTENVSNPHFDIFLPFSIVFDPVN